MISKVKLVYSRLIAAALALLLICSILPAPPSLAAPKSPSEPMISTDLSSANDNISRHDYGRWASPPYSYLYENKNSTLTRVEATGDTILIENFTREGYLIGQSSTLAYELPIFGGFFHGSDANYFVYGKMNEEEKESAEVVRVVKYTTGWEWAGTLSITGSNTIQPFPWGSLDMTEAGGVLYIHSCHQMYKSSDGLNHQANMTFAVRESDMSLLESSTGIGSGYDGYCSHSFNQFIDTDGVSIYRADHGDAYPRGVTISSFAASEGIHQAKKVKKIFDISGEIGDNTTGVTLGGLSLSSKNVLVVGSSVDQTAQPVDFQGTSNIFLSITDKDFKESNLIWLTNYAPGSLIQVGNPYIVHAAEGLDRFLIAWEETSRATNTVTTRFLMVTDNGTPIGESRAVFLRLSDCEPILCQDGLVRWYISTGSYREGSPYLCVVNPYDIEAAVTPLCDFDGDGVTSATDRTILARALAGWEGYSLPSPEEADLDWDGTVSSTDRTVLARSLAGWEGYPM